MPERTILDALTDYWPVIMGFVGTILWGARLESVGKGNQKAIAEMQRQRHEDIATAQRQRAEDISRLERQRAEDMSAHREDREAWNEARKEIAATLNRIFDKIDSLHKELRDQGRQL